MKWKVYSTGPDKDVLIGPEFKPFYEMDRGKDLGLSSWPGEAWKTGGGTVWGWLTYDPELNLVYHGTANPGPWNPDQRPGDNKRKVLVHPERNGYIYVMDRTNGELLSVTPFVHITSSHGVDMKTGRLVPVEDKKPTPGIVVRDICPAAPGAKDWQPSSFSPKTGLVYIPHNNRCMDFEGVEVSYIAGTPYVGANVVYKAGPGGHQGEVTAWDPAKAKPVWTIKEKYPAWSGTLATAGDLVF